MTASTVEVAAKQHEKPAQAKRKGGRKSKTVLIPTEGEWIGFSDTWAVDFLIALYKVAKEHKKWVD